MPETIKPAFFDIFVKPGETFARFAKQIREDNNMLCHFDPLIYQRPEDIPAIVQVRGNHYYALFDDGYIGVAGIYRHERLRQGWHFFLSLDAEYRKSNPDVWAEAIRQFTKKYFNQFTDKYLYGEYLEENKKENDGMLLLNADCIGRHTVFFRGKECETLQYRIAR